jgi:hypothetical protein
MEAIKARGKTQISKAISQNHNLKVKDGIFMEKWLV